MILGILQARAGSSRLPGKVLKPLLGAPMLARQIERLQRSTRLDQLVVATSDQADDLAIAALCAELDVPCSYTVLSTKSLPSPTNRATAPRCALESRLQAATL